MKRINKVDTRSQGTAYGMTAVVMGLVFAGLGSFLAAMGFEVIPLYGKANAPLWVIGAVGLAFAFAGAMVLVQGIGGVLNQRRQRKLLEGGGAMQVASS